jgi:hypothetical protein
MVRSDAWISAAGTPAFSSRSGVDVNSVSTSMMSPEAMRSTGVAAASYHP